MATNRVRGFAPWRPQAKTRVLLDQVLQVLAGVEVELLLKDNYYQLIEHMYRGLMNIVLHNIQCR